MGFEDQSGGTSIRQENELRWEHTARGLTEAETTLGITPDVVESWKNNNSKILEVGTGQGYLIKDLIDSGIPKENIKGLEPGLSFEKPPEVINRLKDSLSEKNLTDQIYPNTAAEAPNVLEKNSVDVALALGPNFQNFATSEVDLLQQIQGLSEVVKPGGKIVFEVALVNGPQGKIPFIEIGENTFDKSKRNPRRVNLQSLLGQTATNFNIANDRMLTGAIEIQIDENTPRKIQEVLDIYNS